MAAQGNSTQGNTFPRHRGQLPQDESRVRGVWRYFLPLYGGWTFFYFGFRGHLGALTVCGVAYLGFLANYLCFCRVDPTPRRRLPFLHRKGRLRHACLAVDSGA